jgi:hypothetical protein
MMWGIDGQYLLAKSQTILQSIASIDPPSHYQETDFTRIEILLFEVGGRRDV